MCHHWRTLTKYDDIHFFRNQLSQLLHFYETYSYSYSNKIYIFELSYGLTVVLLKMSFIRI